MKKYYISTKEIHSRISSEVCDMADEQDSSEILESYKSTLSDIASDNFAKIKATICNEIFLMIGGQRILDLDFDVLVIVGGDGEVIGEIKLDEVIY